MSPSSNVGRRMVFEPGFEGVYEAYKVVKSNHGAAGVDRQTLETFEKDLAGNLYKIWNRSRRSWRDHRP